MFWCCSERRGEDGERLRMIISIIKSEELRSGFKLQLAASMNTVPTRAVDVRCLYGLRQGLLQSLLGHGGFARYA
jgi:hypothetical protein